MQLAEKAEWRLSTVPIRRWQQQTDRTTYLLTSGSPREYAAGHLSGSLSAPGGQLVQETDHYASVAAAHVWS